MIISLEDAGFRTNYTSIYWTYASGFPKAKNNKDGSYVGFQPKPAVEVILVVSKGKSLTWLDDCRIPYSSDSDIDIRPNQETTTSSDQYHFTDHKRGFGNQKGRFPANLLVSDDVLNDGVDHKVGDLDKSVANEQKNCYGVFKNRPRYIKQGDSGSYSRYFDLDKWYSQFIITPKASKSERNKGCEDIEPRIVDCLQGNKDGTLNKRTNHEPSKSNNFHPTVKPLKLMSYLITMGSRENDLVLDPFVGSGTTYLAATQLNRKCVGIELNPEYLEIAKARVKPYLEQQKIVP